jgi:hypothetical protein
MYPQRAGQPGRRFSTVAAPPHLHHEEVCLDIHQGKGRVAPPRPRERAAARQPRAAERERQQPVVEHRLAGRQRDAGGGEGGGGDAWR